jgi:hypothetical protein
MLTGGMVRFGHEAEADGSACASWPALPPGPARFKVVPQCLGKLTRLKHLDLSCEAAWGCYGRAGPAHSNVPSHPTPFLVTFSPRLADRR